MLIGAIGYDSKAIIVSYENRHSHKQIDLSLL